MFPNSVDPMWVHKKTGMVPCKGSSFLVGEWATPNDETVAAVLEFDVARIVDDALQLALRGRWAEVDVREIARQVIARVQTIELPAGSSAGNPTGPYDGPEGE